MKKPSEKSFQRIIGDPFATEETWLSDISPSADVCSVSDDDCNPQDGRSHSMNRRKGLGRMLAAIGIAAAICAVPLVMSQKHSSLPTVPPEPVLSNLYWNGVPDELVLKKSDDGRYIFATTSKRTAQGALQSQILVYDTKQSGSPRLISQSQTEELYGVRIEFPNDWQYHGQPVALVIRQAGAAAEVADVVRLDDGKVKPIERWYGDRFEVANFDSRSDSVLILHQRTSSIVDVPLIFTWSGAEAETLSQTSEKFPEYYRKVLAELDEPALKEFPGTNYQYGKAQLMSFAGQKQEAKRLLERLLREGRSEGDPEIMQNIKSTLKSLANN